MTFSAPLVDTLLKPRTTPPFAPTPENRPSQRDFSEEIEKTSASSPETPAKTEHHTPPKDTERSVKRNIVQQKSLGKAEESHDATQSEDEYKIDTAHQDIILEFINLETNDGIQDEILTPEMMMPESVTDIPLTADNTMMGTSAETLPSLAEAVATTVATPQPMPSAPIMPMIPVTDDKDIIHAGETMDVQNIQDDIQPIASKDAISSPSSIPNPNIISSFGRLYQGELGEQMPKDDMDSLLTDAPITEEFMPSDLGGVASPAITKDISAPLGGGMSLPTQPLPFIMPSLQDKISENVTLSPAEDSIPLQMPDPLFQDTHSSNIQRIVHTNASNFTLPEGVHVSVKKKEGDKREMRIDIDPKGVGSVNLTLETKDNIVSAVIRSENPALLEWLKRDSQMLQNAFSEMGLNLSNQNMSFEQQTSSDSQHRQDSQQTDFDIRYNENILNAPALIHTGSGRLSMLSPLSRAHLLTAIMTQDKIDIHI